MTNTAKRLDNELLDSLIDAQLEDLLAADDEAILVEAAEIHANPSDAAKKLRDLAMAAIIEAGKRRLMVARATLDAQEGMRGKVLTWPLQHKRDLVSRLRQEIQGLTLAARQGQDETETEVDCVIEDLIDIGVIDEDGRKI